MKFVPRKKASTYSLPFEPHWSSWYPGYSAEDLEVFSCFPIFDAQARPGFVTNFVGVQTRTSDLWNSAREFDGRVTPPPIPNDLFEGAEWVAVMKSMISMQDSCRVAEIGAGWGPWVVSCAQIARKLGIDDIRVYGYEADPGRFNLMERHFTDNRFQRSQYKLFMQAVGPERGRARWPKIQDAPNSGGARPVRDDGVNTVADINYMGEANEWLDIEVVAFSDVLAQEKVWDLIHIDIQGWEYQVCAATMDELNARVGWVVIGTHSRAIDSDLMQLFIRNGWVLENEKPTAFRFREDAPTLESMTYTDGVQGWRNPRLRADWRSYVVEG